VTARTLANGRYALSEPPLGAGGMGTVWKAYDTVLHREVAVKELRIPDGLSPEDRETLRARAMREARAAAGLDHPGIVTIHDVVDEDGMPWIVMRLLSGRSLDKVVRADGPLSPRRAAELGVRLLDALTAAHNKGVLHRDVKPQNVMLDGGGHWMLTDFGIASVAGATRTLTGTGQVTGTLGYIAPERLSGAEFGPAADLWALGATLYFAVEGRHAYDHDDLPALIAAVLTRDPDVPRRAGPLAPVIAGLMERDPARRLTAAAAREQLLATAEGHPTFEAPTVRIGAPDGPTRKLEPPPGAEPSGRVVRALRYQLMALNGAIGALLGMIAYGLADGMPLWILGALAVAFAIGGGLGAWLATYLGRWLGLTTALAGTALLMGESIAGAGLVGAPENPIPAIVLAGIALVALAAWHRLAASMRRRVVPAEQLGRVTAGYRGAGFAAVLIGGALTGGYFWLEPASALFGGNYVVGILVTVGALVVIAGLLAIPALAAGDTEPSKPAAKVATAVAALVIPVLLGGQAVVRYVEGFDDFTALPNICATDVVSQEQVTAFFADPPERVTQEGTGTQHIFCEWRQTSGDVAGLRLDVTLYESSRRAARELQFERDQAEEDEDTLIDIELGEEAVRHWYDSSIDSEDTLGVAIEVRIENLVLEVEFDRSAALGPLDEKDAMALASDLVREVEGERPSR
jgi:tRNA A-37 threonylcarbamoyl transferase component Bud32